MLLSKNLKQTKKKKQEKSKRDDIFHEKKTKLLNQLFNYAYLDRLKIIVLFIGWYRT